jgi:sterol desaturase/sphingolipid hydroxylase (fatty acid hydroxylase superfamily)
MSESRRPRLSLETTEPTTFGSGFISGLLSAILGLVGLGLALSLRFPDYFGYSRLEPLHGLGYLRAAIHVVLVAAFLLGTLSAFLRANKALALSGLVYTLLAALVGGSQVPVGGDTSGTAWLGVDFFVLNLLLYSAVFIPMERLFALRADQPVFRRQWLLDLTYFFLNAVLIEVLTLLTLRPALILFDWARMEPVRGIVAALPLPLEVAGLLLVADFSQYWVHRAFHRSGRLWGFHAIHHSVEQMDWIAGSRLHLVDVVVTRGLTYVPIFILGFTEAALMVYVFIVAAQATFIHANVKWELRAIRRVVVTPAFHHWHHASEPEAIDRNFAVHTPVWDRLFGTYYLPDRWPSSYGLAHPPPVPARWVGQFLHPFRRLVRRVRPAVSPTSVGKV